MGDVFFKAHFHKDRKNGINCGRVGMYIPTKASLSLRSKFAVLRFLFLLSSP